VSKIILGLYAALGARQFRPIKPEFFTDAPHFARIERLTTAATERRERLAILSMHGDHDVTLIPLVMLIVVEPASTLGEPLPKCAALHNPSPNPLWV
jgi:hypothetical protein